MNEKKNKHFESARSQDRKTEANLEQECFGGAENAAKHEASLRSWWVIH
jgi:hypothetical protein